MADIETLDCGSKKYDTPLRKEEGLVCEVLVREIGRAERWSAVLDGFNALLHVRHMASDMHKEADDSFREEGRARADIVDGPLPPEGASD